MLHSISASSVGPSDIQLGTESRFSLAPLQSVAQSSAFPPPLEHLLLLDGASLVRVCWTRGLESRCTVTIINYFTLIDQWLEWTDQWFLQCVFPSWCDSVQSATFKDCHLPSLWCCHQSCSLCTCRGTQEEGLEFTQRLKVIKQEECRIFFSCWWFSVSGLFIYFGKGEEHNWITFKEIIYKIEILCTCTGMGQCHTCTTGSVFYQSLLLVSIAYRFFHK